MIIKVTRLKKNRRCGLPKNIYKYKTFINIVLELNLLKKILTQIFQQTEKEYHQTYQL